MARISQSSSLYTSKTHGIESRPQGIKISAMGILTNRHFCPFNATGEYINDDDPFFVFKDKLTPVEPRHVRSILKSALKRLNLNSNLYSLHSFRIGRSTDMVKFGYTVEQVRIADRWKSNTVYKYIHLANDQL